MSETKKNTKKPEAHVIHIKAEEKLLITDRQERNQAITELIEETEGDLLFIDTEHFGVDVPPGDAVIDVRPTSKNTVYVANISLSSRNSDIDRYFMLKKVYSVLKADKVDLKNLTVLAFDDGVKEPAIMALITNAVFPDAEVFAEKITGVDNAFKLEMSTTKKSKSKKKKNKKKKGKK